jgi:O-antigen ligase
VTAVFSLSKGAAGIALAMSAWIILGGTQSLHSIRRGAAVFCGLSLVVIAGIGATEYAGTNFDMLWRMDSIGRSVSVRLDLWSLAFTAFMDHFPFGLGLGQFWEVVGTDTNLAREGHRHVHNSFLTLMAELGLLGLVLAVGLLSLLVAAMRGWPPMLWPLFALLIFVPLMIHDAHSIRMLMLITALGLAKFFTNKDKIASCDGS